MNRRFGFRSVPIIVLTAAVLVAAVFVGVLLFRPSPNEAFRKTVEQADSVIFISTESRDGDDPVLFTPNDPEEIAKFRELWEFEFRGSYACACCGFPEIDWYREDLCIAKTSFHHGKNLRWDAFSNDLPLTKTARDHVCRWLLARTEGLGAEKVPESCREEWRE